MRQKPLAATNDFVFQKVFGGNPPILRDFLEAALDLPAEEFKDLKVLDPNLDREFIEDKLGILDVKATTSTGKVINIEIQIKPQRFIWQRMLFYTSKMVVEQVKSGYQYDKINRAISILIADFVMVKENDAYHNRFRLHDEKTGARYLDSIEINVLELPKMHKADGTRLGDWLRFFRATTEDEYMTVAQTNPAINEAWGVIKVLSGDERARAMAAARDKAQMDLDSHISDARREGRQEGRQEGINSVAEKLLRKHMSYDDIAGATGLSLEEVRRLAANLK